MTKYVISGCFESSKVWWTGVEWSPLNSQAWEFETRDEANLHRDTSLEIKKPVTIGHLKVEHAR